MNIAQWWNRRQLRIAREKKAMHKAKAEALEAVRANCYGWSDCQEGRYVRARMLEAKYSERIEVLTFGK